MSATLSSATLFAMLQASPDDLTLLLTVADEFDSMAEEELADTLRWMHRTGRHPTLQLAGVWAGHWQWDCGNLILRERKQNPALPYGLFRQMAGIHTEPYHRSPTYELAVRTMSRARASLKQQLGF